MLQGTMLFSRHDHPHFTGEAIQAWDVYLDKVGGTYSNIITVLLEVLR